MKAYLRQMGTFPPNEQELEFCSECGNFVDVLHDGTGWCYECSRKLGYLTPSCPSCEKETSDGKLCSRCKYESWLERNADSIELIMVVQDVTVRTAKRLVAAQNRPICQSCHEPIKGGQKGRHFFCKRNPECAKGHRVYEYHLRTKPQSEALALAVTASMIYKLTANISNR